MEGPHLDEQWTMNGPLLGNSLPGRQREARQCQ